MQKSKNPRISKKNSENTSESGIRELIYMEPGVNQMNSPITSGRQTLNKNQSPKELKNQNLKNPKIQNPKNKNSKNRKNLKPKSPEEIQKEEKEV